MNSRTCVLLVASLALAACGKDSADGDKSAGAAAAKDGNAAGGKATSASKASASKDKDKGELTMKLGDEDWAADRARATRRGTGITIKANQTGRIGDVMQRDELHLAIADFQGPGDYTGDMSGSRFVRVGIDMKAAKASEGDDNAASAEAMKALTGSKHMMLMGAKITITAASDTEVSGTFAWTPPPKVDNPTITGGSFRAIVK